ncbi:hypothetical protein ANN_23251 [Periplaneta americana]|uniref:Uncharacterized protein n=1 Tax=Periplaneta americana TaxID=6978 RepID=A0ABQ8SKK0_PERAM|nr:hypothetical protein ANN_23251 [Periplaneta americana]
MAGLCEGGNEAAGSLKAVCKTGQEERILFSHGEPYDFSSSPFFPGDHRAALIPLLMNIKRPRIESGSAPDAQLCLTA